MNFLRMPCEHVDVSSTLKPLFAQENKKWVLVATILGSSLAFIDGTVVNVALPARQDALHASISQIQWVIEAYSLSLAALLLGGGALQALGAWAAFTSITTAFRLVLEGMVSTACIMA